MPKTKKKEAKKPTFVLVTSYLNFANPHYTKIEMQVELPPNYRKWETERLVNYLNKTRVNHKFNVVNWFCNEPPN